MATFGAIKEHIYEHLLYLYMAEIGDIIALLNVAETLPLGAERLAALTKAREHLTAVIGCEIAEYDDNGGLAGSPYSNPANWAAHECNMAKSEGNRLVATGRLARRFDAIAEGIAEGVLNQSHVKKFRQCLPGNRTRTRAELFERDHKMLVDLARDLPYSEFALACDAWILAALDVDPHAKAPEDKDLTIGFTDNKNGTTTIKGLLLTSDAELLRQGLLRLVDQARQSAEDGGGTSGSEIKAEDDHLNLSEYTLRPVVRRGKKYWMARGCGLLATLANTSPKDGRSPEPLVAICMDVETFDREADKFTEWIATERAPASDPTDVFRPGYQCQTTTGTPLLPREAFRLALKHRIARFVLDPATRKVELGRSQRLFTGAARMAVVLRDRTCRSPGCDRPGEQVDHRIEWQDGGYTNPENGRLYCTPCHKGKTQVALAQRRRHTIHHEEPF